MFTQKQSQFAVFLSALLLIALSACLRGGQESTPLMPAETEPAPVSDTPTNITSPTETAEPTETEAPVIVEPTEAALQGFAVQYPCMKAAPCVMGDAEFSDGDILALHEPVLNLLVEKRLEGLGQVLHVFGRLDDYGYYFQDFDSQEVIEIISGTEPRRLSFPGMYHWLGVPGEAGLALTILPGTSPDIPYSQIQMFPGVGYMALGSVEMQLVVPVQVDRSEDVLRLWYTREPYGIGGDIIFPVWNGLFKTDGVNEETLLAEEYGFSGVSADGTKIAFIEQYPVGDMQVLDLVNGTKTVFPLLPESDRGAGYAFFSPDGSHLAWLEAHGSVRTDDMELTLRMAPLDGGVPLSWSASQLAEVLGREIRFMRPVGWYDNQRLLVQIDPLQKGDMPYVMVLDLLSSAAPQMVPGSFVGFIWSK